MPEPNPNDHPEKKRVLNLDAVKDAERKRKQGRCTRKGCNKPVQVKKDGSFYAFCDRHLKQNAKYQAKHREREARRG